MLFGAWLLAVGALFAIWPTEVSHIADRLRLQPQNQVSRRQARYARFAGIAIAIAGALIVLALWIDRLAKYPTVRLDVLVRNRATTVGAALQADGAPRAPRSEPTKNFYRVFYRLVRHRVIRAVTR